MTGGYGYEVRSYNNGFGGVAPPVAEKWKKLEYTESDHVARQQPYIPSTESYLVKSERIIEKVHTPPTVIEYSTVSPVKYGVERNRWGSTIPSAVDDRPRKMEEFVTQVQTEVSQPHPHLLRPPPRLSHDYKHDTYPSGEYGQRESDKWSRSSSPVSPPVAEYNKHSSKSEFGGQANNWGSRNRPSSQVRDTEQIPSPSRPGYLSNTSHVPEHVQTLPPAVTEYTHSPNSPLRNHSTENNPWVRNSQPGLLRSANWHQMPNSSFPTAQGPQTGYDSYNDYKGKEVDRGRPGGNYSYSYDDDTPKNYTSEQYKYISTEPSPQLARGAWTRPGPGSWATTTTKITTLTRPTSDINEAVNYLTGAVQQSSLTHASPQQQYYNTLGHPKMDHYTDAIDSREAQSRYGNMSGSTTARESYATTTIDSREALRKYGGVPI